MLICKCTTQGTIWKKKRKSSWSGLDEGNLQENGEINMSLTIYSINLRFILEWIENWELLWCVGQYLPSTLDSSYSLPLQMFLLPCSFSCLSVTPTKCILDHLIMSHTSRTFCSVFFPLDSDNFYWTIFKFTDAFFSWVQSCKHIKWIHFWYCSFQLYNFHLILL